MILVRFPRGNQIGVTEYDGRYQYKAEKIDGLGLYFVFRKLQYGLSEQQFLYLRQCGNGHASIFKASKDNKMNGLKRRKKNAKQCFAFFL